MWVFGYGSLMWDDWEEQFGCLSKKIACAHGYRRAFNKASIERWGTRLHRGPTLNLTRVENGVCVGSAFEFSDDCYVQLMEYLTRREGGFDFDTLSLELHDGLIVSALAPVYRGKYLMPDQPIAEVAKLVALAKGTKGACSIYVKNIASKLAEMGIEDATVAELTAALD